MSNHYLSISEIIGTVGRILDSDEFILETTEGGISIDTDLDDSYSLGLTPGETVTVTGYYDDDGFDATSITRPDGSSVFSSSSWEDDDREDDTWGDDDNHSNDDIYDDNGNHLSDDIYDDNGNHLSDDINSGQGTEIIGTVGMMLDSDEFILETSNGEISIDANLEDSFALGLTLGETVTVKGYYDDDGFDATSITRPDGSSVFSSSSWEDSHSSNHAKRDDDSLFNTAINRFQNRQIGGTYLFAGDMESVSLRENHGETFQEEGFAFRVSDKPGENLETMYRMRNKDVPGTYLYVGEEEKQSIAVNHTNFENEGIAFYVMGANVNQGQDVYRFQSLSNPGTYLFALEQEKNSILANHSSQFVLEGIAFEVG
ncbi:MAG: DUF5666 domain-containing protein [Synechocystis sp.]|nr:DUF5666 domain-containing protein [Synechocystis sp.]